jgi:fatty acid-binding protein DegV
VGTERTQRAALQKVLELAQIKMGSSRAKRLAVVHGNIPVKAENWVSEARTVLEFDEEPYVVDFGPALAVHFGPGLLGVALQWE